MSLPKTHEYFTDVSSYVRPQSILPRLFVYRGRVSVCNRFMVALNRSPTRCLCHAATRCCPPRRNKRLCHQESRRPFGVALIVCVLRVHASLPPFLPAVREYGCAVADAKKVRRVTPPSSRYRRAPFRCRCYVRRSARRCAQFVASRRASPPALPPMACVRAYTRPVTFFREVVCAPVLRRLIAV